MVRCTMYTLVWLHLAQFRYLNNFKDVLWELHLNVWIVRVTWWRGFFLAIFWFAYNGENLKSNQSVTAATSSVVQNKSDIWGRRRGGCMFIWYIKAIENLIDLLWNYHQSFFMTPLLIFCFVFYYSVLMSLLNFLRV